MARLPQVGADTGNWGTILNDFLAVAHNADGSSKAFFNVKEYGAKGDGSNDTTAIQNTIATAAAAGGTVYFPAGTYKYYAALNITVSMKGASMGKTTLIGAQWTLSTSNVEISDLKFVSTNAIAINSANCDNLRLHRVEVDHDASVTQQHLGWSVYNIYRMSATECKFNIGGLQLSGCKDFLIQGNYWDCQYLNVNEPAHISGASSGVFNGNTVYRTATDAVDLYNAGHYCIVSNNRFIGLRGAAGMEVKVAMADDPNNSSAPGKVIDGTVIANNIFRDFNSTASPSTRNGIYAEYYDNRTTKAFAVSETNRALTITGNILEDFNASDPGSGVLVNYQAIVYTGHNGIISNNIIRNMRSWNGSTTEGIALSQRAAGVPLGQKSVGVNIVGNVICGVENGYGIRTGNLDYCTIDGNIIRGDEVNGTNTKFGIDIDSGATLNMCSISNNLFQCNNSAGFGIRSNYTTNNLNNCTISGNRFKDCGVSIYKAVQCVFTGNSFDNATNSQNFTVGNTNTSSVGNSFTNNQFLMSNDYILGITNMNGFIISGNIFKSSSRPLLIAGTSTNGVIANNLSFTQSSSGSLVLFSSVSSANQATTYIDTNTNKILA